MTEQPFSTISEAISDVHCGGMVVVCGGEGSADQGQLMLSAQYASPETINFMAKDGRGLICLALEPQRCDELGLKLMTATTSDTTSPAAFTVSVDAREGVTTGISSHDRARTIQVVVDPTCARDDLVHPGHVFPLRTREGGVLACAGSAEAAVDLARLAGLTAAAVTCVVINDDGSVARVPDLEQFCGRHGLKLVTVEQILRYRRRCERLVRRDVEVKLPTAFGEFCAAGYRSLIGTGDHVALIKGHPDAGQSALVHVHQTCLTGDALRALSCECRSRLETAMATIEAAGTGVLVYLARSGPPALADHRPDYAVAAQILVDLGLTTIRLIEDDPEAAGELHEHGLRVLVSSPDHRATVPEIEPLPRLTVAHAQGALPLPSARSV